MYTASCSCGQLSAQVDVERIRYGICHCLDCQRRTGSLFGAQTRVLRDKVTLTGESKAWTRTGDAGAVFTFHFCPVCGATVYFTELGDDAGICLPVGAFADSTLPAPGASVYDKRRHHWVVLPDGTKRFETDPP